MRAVPGRAKYSHYVALRHLSDEVHSHTKLSAPAPSTAIAGRVIARLSRVQLCRSAPLGLRAFVFFETRLMTPSLVKITSQYSALSDEFERVLCRIELIEKLPNGRRR